MNVTRWLTDSDRLLWTRRHWSEPLALLGVLALAVAVQLGPLLAVDLQRGAAGLVVAAGLFVVAATGLALGTVWRVRRRMSCPRVVVLLAGQAAVVSVLVARFGHEHPFAECLFGWLVLIVLPQALGWVSYVVVGAVWAVRISPLVDELARGSAAAHYWAYGVIIYLLTGVMVSGLLLTARLAHQLRVARDEAARLAAGQERARIARDLHDTLGQSLTAIVVQSELVERQLMSDTEGALAQLRTLHATAQHALDDVRKVARGCRVPEFEHELATASQLLEDVGVRCVLEIDRMPRDETAQVLGWALREAITNVLRHSAPTTCVIRCAPVEGGLQLIVENDGVLDQLGSREEGGGLEGLTRRMAEFGGSVEATAVAGGRFRLATFVPGVRETRSVR